MISQHSDGLDECLERYNENSNNREQEDMLLDKQIVNTFYQKGKDTNIYDQEFTPNDNRRHSDKTSVEKDIAGTLNTDTVINDQNAAHMSNVTEQEDKQKFIDNIRILAWNVQGLRSKLNSKAFIKFSEQFKIISFSETWACKKEDIENVYPDYEVYSSQRSKFSKGGLVVCVHKSLCQGVTRIFEHVEDKVFLIFDKCVFESSFDFIVGFVYIAPECSIIYGEDNETGIEHLDDDIDEISQVFPDLPLLLCGDFNARIGDMSDLEGMNQCKHAQPLTDVDEFLSQSERPQMERKTKDKATNKFGQKLLEVLKEHSLFIVNGRRTGDQEGEITCIANRGMSIVDYFICSMPLFDKIIDMSVLDRSESDHFPIVAVLDFKEKGSDDNSEDIELNDKIRFSYKEQYSSNYKEYIQEHEETELLDFLDALETSVDAAAHCVVSFMQTAAEKMKAKQKKPIKTSSQPTWWDDECEQRKQDKYRKLKQFRGTNAHADLNQYIDSKKTFKELCKTKQKEENMKTVHDLHSACLDSNSKSFWQKLKSLTGSKPCASSISPDAWYQYFKRLLNAEVTDQTDFLTEVKDNLDEHTRSICDRCMDFEFDDIISEKEICKAINNMKKGKAPGPDGLPTDLFFYAKENLVKFLCPLFNKVFESGDYPHSWTEAVIYPLHKKGSRKLVNNYRGISLLNVISKIYSSIINERLTKFCAKTKAIPEAQAGFRKGYSTIDNVFTLQSLVTKYLTKSRGRFYSLFVDFSKAFDCVQREKLLYLLLSMGLHGKMFRSLKGMYKEVKAAVCVGNKITEYFECISGVRQGCILSPLLFSMFLSELQSDLTKCDARGIDVFADTVGIFSLMYADDIALVADTVIDLQKKVNCLEKYCNKWGLTVNMDKTKVVVFKNGGFVKKSEKWNFGEKEIQVVPSYCYLGVIFSSTLNWSKCVQNLSSKALRAVAGIKKLYFKLETMPSETLFKIFDAKIKPILLYGSEIWGYKQYDYIERVQNKICKMVLGVGRDVRNKIVLGECGRFPIYIDTQVQVMKYWCKIIHLEENRYPRQCYDMLLRQDRAGKNNWVTNIRNILCKIGFGIVWEMQNPGNINMFLTSFKTRLQDIYRQNWNEAVSSVQDYILYHPEIIKAAYISDLDNIKHRRAVCLLRSSSIALNGIPRFGNMRNDCFCKQCDGNHVEDLIHFLLKCPRYTRLRQKYIPPFYFRCPSSTKVQLLILNLKGKLACKVAVYITECLNIRNQ